MSATRPKPSPDVPQDVSQLTDTEHAEVEVLEPGALATTEPDAWEGSALVQQLQWAAHETDPLADALQAQLGRESRAAYAKDWRTFTRWLASKAPGMSADSAADVHRALVAWLRLGDEQARGLVVRWVADQKRQGLAAPTVNRRLASLRWVARLAANRGMADVRLHLVKGLKAEGKRRDMRGPAGVANLQALVAQAEQLALAPGGGGEAGAARNRAVAHLLLLNGLRRGEVARISLADWNPAEPLQLAIRGKGRTEREAITLDPLVAQSLAAWLEVRPSWAPTEPWAPMFVALDPAVHKRMAASYLEHLAAAAEQLEQDGAAEGTPPWLEEMGLACRSWAFGGGAIYRLVRAMGAEALEGRVVSPHRLRHSAVTTAVADLGFSMADAQALARHKNVATTQSYFDRAGELQAKVTSGLAAFLTTPTPAPAHAAAN
jgi:integrase/recombinase XerC